MIRLSKFWQLFEIINYLNYKQIQYIQERWKYTQQICRIENLFVSFF